MDLIESDTNIDEKRENKHTPESLEDNALASLSKSELIQWVAILTKAQLEVAPALRQHACQEYLRKRELQQIELLRADIADDEAVFRGTKTKGESGALKQKKPHLAVIDNRQGSGYHQMPKEFLIDTKFK
ncbi:hypothetical protein C8R43DRAFT_1187233 [Mycena crocata]|nr:hypothetical protein C8R43DRAFT_1187233 [Mycena crocata]